ncbi:hypothetical protein [Methanoculleus sp.]|uniref:hypothetical protein n=1 Tax=Methanoculleus sp. TaxID=90427 RepID=UPI0025E33A49|nr:hypothetical protein [Methanoculleus sp.]MCK9320352.1 hypothetical protein [Methanoculleus sp.]
MKLKGIELKGTYKVVYYNTSFEVYDEKGNRSYYEDSYGYWAKWEYDGKGDVIYCEDKGGILVNKRVKELTIEQIEKLLGYKIKIKGE